MLLRTKTAVRRRVRLLTCRWRIVQIYRVCLCAATTTQLASHSNQVKAGFSLFHKNIVYNIVYNYIQLIFTSVLVVESKSVENSVYGVISHIPVPFHLPNSDGCTLGIKCPLTNGTTVTESVTMPVKNEYPKVSIWNISCRKKIIRIIIRCYPHFYK